MATIHLPEFDEWYGYPRQEGVTPPHQVHWTHFAHDGGRPDEGCPGCAVGPMLRAIHQAVYVEGKFLEETWALQDGYGEPGVIPDQGWDWSGIRDSSPAAIKRMYDVIHGNPGFSLADVANGLWVDDGVDEGPKHWSER